MSKESLLPSPSSPTSAKINNTKKPSLSKVKLGLVTVSALLTFVLLGHTPLPLFSGLCRLPGRLHADAYPGEPLPTCVSEITGGPPLEEFLERQKKLVEVLTKEGSSGYVAEPGANTLYYFNISAKDWSLSERPFLLVLTPSETTNYSVNILVPAFEKTRALTQLPSLALPPSFSKDDSVISWEESASPYAALPRLLKAGEAEKVFVDEGMRLFIMDGIKGSLSGGDVSVSSASLSIRGIRERKSAYEINLMKCANELTLFAIKSTRDKITFGMTEPEVSTILTNEFIAVGMPGGGGLVLFGENAALPHGKSGNRTLTEEDFVLIDAGGTFYGYSSDVTRTFALTGSKIPAEHMTIWYTVQKAQKAANATAAIGNEAKMVDKAARDVIVDAGYGEYFTHRLGHGIGLETHENPYLHSGSLSLLKEGNTFSNEPGIYIEDKVGVRLEDCWVMTEDGAVMFTKAATSPFYLG